MRCFLQRKIFMSSNIKENMGDLQGIQNLKAFENFIDGLSLESTKWSGGTLFGHKFTYARSKSVQSICLAQIFAKLSQLVLNSDFKSLLTIETKLKNKLRQGKDKEIQRLSKLESMLKPVRQNSLQAFRLCKIQNRKEKLRQEGTLQEKALHHHFLILNQVRQAKDKLKGEKVIKKLGELVKSGDLSAFKIFGNICSMWEKQEQPYGSTRAISEIWIDVITNSQQIAEIMPLFLKMNSRKLKHNERIIMRDNFQSNPEFAEGVSIIKAGPRIIQDTFLTFLNKPARLAFVKKLYSLRDKLEDLKEKFDQGAFHVRYQMSLIQKEISKLKLEDANKRFLKENKGIIIYLRSYRKLGNLPYLKQIKKEFIPIEDSLLDTWIFPHSNILRSSLHARSIAAEMDSAYEDFFSEVEPHRQKLSNLLERPIPNLSEIKGIQERIKKIKSENYKAINIVQSVCKIYDALINDENLKLQFDKCTVFALDRDFYQRALIYNSLWAAPVDTWAPQLTNLKRFIDCFFCRASLVHRPT